MNYLKCEKGIAMPLVLVILLVLTLLGAALWNYGMSELNQSVREEKRARAYYVARAGAESVARDIMNDPTPLTAITEIGDQLVSDELTYNPEIPTEGEEKYVGELTVELERVSENRVEITGTGSVDNVIQSVSIVIETQEEFDGVVYSLGNLDFQSGVTLNGDVVSGGIVNPPDNFNGTIKEETEIKFPHPEFRDVPESYTGTLTIDKDGTLTIDRTSDIVSGDGQAGPYQKIFIDHSAKLILDASQGALTLETKVFDMHNNANMLEFKTHKDHDLILIVDEIDLKKVRVTGNGTAYLYVRSMINVQTPHADVDDEALLFVRLDKGCIMEMQANSNFEGLVYGPEAVVEIAGNADFHGAMIVEQLKGSGGSFTIGSAGTVIDRGKYSWDFLGLDYGGYWMVHWLR